MAAEERPEEQAQAPKFRDALMRGDFKSLLHNEEYEPHMQMLLLLLITYAVGALTMVFMK
jgi:hypothetical protein